MPDWTKSMQQSFEYYVVEPTTLADVKRLDTVKKATFNRDADSETIESATIDITDIVGEDYIRGYLVTVQNGVTEKHALGTTLIQTPSSTFNGKAMDVSADAYSPLLELKEKQPPIGYTIPKGTRIMDAAYRIVRENCRVPVNKVEPRYRENDAGEKIDISPTLNYDFVANADDNWLSFVSDLISYAKYELALSETGRILFSPKQDTASLQPVWTYDDDNSSILHPEVTMNHDLYGIYNTVEVIYTYGSETKRVKVVNDDPNSPTSTINRGREIPYRETDPNLTGYVTDEQLKEYAESLLKALSTLEYTISYTHAYCPVRDGDCVRLNYMNAGLIGIKAKVISQTINCELGCSVSEKAVFSKKLWR
jgi:hypothetical protein